MSELSTALHARGLRVTPQRQHVLDAVRSMGHATPEAIAEAVPGVDLATVYRTLELLEELGLVRHTHLGHGAATYRPAEDEHIHAVCHACGRRVDQPADLVDDLAATLLQREGFVVDRSHLTVFGRCRDCAAGAADTSVGSGTAPGGEQMQHHEH
jgi:Fur family ferric uptake transcriptional regulator